MTSGAVRIAAPAGRCRGARRAACAGSGARSAGRRSERSRGTALSGLHHKERWLAFGASLAEGETIKESAERCGIAPSTAHRWRHRFLAAVRQAPDRLAGIVEADETFVLESPERGAEARPEAAPARRQGPQTRSLARAGADPGRRRSWRRDPQPYPARSHGGQREAGAGAGPRPGCAARLRRQTAAIRPSRRRSTSLTRASTPLLASGSGALCTSRRSTAVTVRSRASCAGGAASPPSTSTAI